MEFESTHPKNQGLKDRKTNNGHDIMKIYELVKVYGL